MDSNLRAVLLACRHALLLLVGLIEQYCHVRHEKRHVILISSEEKPTPIDNAGE